MTFSLGRTERRERTYDIAGLTAQGAPLTPNFDTVEVALVRANGKVVEATEWTTLSADGDEFTVIWEGPDVGDFFDGSLLVPLGEWDLKIKLIDEPEVDIIDGERIVCS